MNKNFLYNKSFSNQQDSTDNRIGDDSLKKHLNIEVLKSKLKKSDTGKDSLVQMINQGYDATSYYFAQSKESAPLKDYFLNPLYFSERNQRTSTEHKNESLALSKSGKFSLNQSDVLLLVLLLLASLIAFVRFSTHNYINRIVASVFSFAYSRTLYNERNKLLLVKDFVLQIVFFVSAGILLVQIMDYFHLFDEKEISSQMYYFAPVIIFLFVISYRIFVRILGALTYTSGLVSEYLYYFSNSLKFLGIFNVIVLFALLFGTPSLQVFIIYASFFVYVSIYLLRIYKIILDFLSNRFSLFYLILYFCALEIVPIIMLIKQISNNTSINFLF